MKQVKEEKPKKEGCSERARQATHEKIKSKERTVDALTKQGKRNQDDRQIVPARTLTRNRMGIKVHRKCEQGRHTYSKIKHRTTGRRVKGGGQREIIYHNVDSWKLGRRPPCQIMRS